MKIRNAIHEDINDIMNLLKEGKEFLKSLGVDQWQGNYPNIEVVKNDIDMNQCYVVIIENKIAGTVVLSFEEEESYNNMLEGKWISDNPYGAIHRIAVDSNYKGRGIGKKLFDFCDDVAINKNIKSIKVDTHKNNEPMQKLMQRCGYMYCGIVIQSGGERTAFEKLL